MKRRIPTNPITPKKMGLLNICPKLMLDILFLLLERLLAGAE
jgi:hypothetical protein